MELEVFGWRCQHSHQVECHHCNANSRWSVGSLEVKIEASGGQQAPPGWSERRRHSLASVVRMERPPLRNTDGMTTGFAAKKPIVLHIICSVSSGIVKVFLRIREYCFKSRFAPTSPDLGVFLLIGMCAVLRGVEWCRRTCLGNKVLAFHDLS